jgi:hypothetical protein
MRKTLLLAIFAVAIYCFSIQKQPAVGSVASMVNRVSHVEPDGDKTKALITRVNFEDSLRNLYEKIRLDSYDLDYEVFRLGMMGYYSLDREGALNKQGLITIINFARPSTEKRFYTIDLKNKEVKYHTYVAHGRNTGENLATEFSNTPHSNQSSLGFFVTGETYVGSKGYSMRLDGKEKSFNDKARSRAVVIHAADYATESWIKRYGRLGRSQGCPALPPDLSREVINTIKDKTAIFTYYPDKNYLNASRYLRIEDLFDKLDEQPVQLAGRS